MCEGGVGGRRGDMGGGGNSVLQYHDDLSYGLSQNGYRIELNESNIKWKPTQ
jgi:hypothetical protein